MKKRFIAFVAVAAVVITATAVLASGTVSLGTISNVEKEFVPNFDRLAEYMGYDTDERFEKFHRTALFMGKYCTNAESFDYIEQMILDGCDVKTTIDIYQFYLTTNEPISIVRTIYDMVYAGEEIINRDVVFENAFNKITNNKCGVLTKDDVEAYLEKGLSVSDISEANLLCRKGVMTISEILDARLAGIEWSKIVEAVSGQDISEKYLKADSAVLTSALSAARVTNEPLDSVLAENEEERLMNAAKKVNAQLKQKGYWKGKKSENFEKIAKKAAEKGIDEEKLESLLDEGYSELELINCVNDKACNAKTIDSIVKAEVAK